MKIKLNGKEKEIAENSSLENLIDELNLRNTPIVAEVSGKIISPENYSETILQEEDTVELIRFVGGGCRYSV